MQGLFFLFFSPPSMGEGRVRVKTSGQFLLKIPCLLRYAIREYGEVSLEDHPV